MKYVVAMNFRMNGSPSENDAAVKRMLDLYAKWSPPKGTTFHQFLGRLDGGGTFAIVETDNPSEIAETTSQFGPYVEYELYPVQDIEDTVGAAAKGVAFRESVG